MAEISNPNYNDQEEHGGTKKCMEVKLSSIQGEYGRKNDFGSLWIQFILRKTENWKLKTKKKNKKVTIHTRCNVHMPKCTVCVPWTVQEALKKKKKKKQDVGSTKHTSQMLTLYQGSTLTSPQSI